MPESKYIDIRVRGFGRIKKASGTSDPHLFAEIKQMIRQRRKIHDVEFFRVLQSGELNAVELHRHWVAQTLPQALKSTNSKPFGHVYEWVANYSGIGDDQRYNYRNQFRQLEALRPVSSVSEIPDLLRRYKELCEKAKKYRMFNSVRNTCRSYFSDTLDKYHTLYIEVARIKPLTGVKKRRDTALSICEIEVLRNHSSPEVARQISTMAYSGIELKIYERGLWVVLSDRVEIHGTKMARGDNRRNRVIPKVYDMIPVKVKRKAFRRHLRSAAVAAGLNRQVQIKDLRNTYANILENSGIPDNRATMYLGHAPISMTKQYSSGAVAGWLVEDAKTIMAYIATQVKRCREGSIGLESLVEEVTPLSARMYFRGVMP